MAATYGGNFAEPMALVLQGACHMCALGGDSQSEVTRHYLFSAMLACLKPRLGYMTCSSNEYNADSPVHNAWSNGSLASTTIAKTSYGGVVADDVYGSVPNTQCIRPAVVSVWAGNPAATNAMSSGPKVYRVNGSPSSGMAGFPWACGASNAGKPWHHGSYVKSRLVTWREAGSTVDQWQQYAQRSDGTTTNNASMNSVTLSAGSGPVAGGWSNVLQDHGTYSAIANSVTNDHDVNHYIFTAAGAYDETGLAMIPLCAQITRCNSGGTIDTTAMGFDAFGRPGAYADRWANGFGTTPTVVTQSTWEKYLTATVINPVIVDFTMLGHNADTPERTGDELNDTFSANMVTYINRKKAAAVASGFAYYPIIVAPWRSGGTSQFDSVAKCQRATARFAEIAAAVNGGWFSFLEAFSNEVPLITLHPQTRGDGMMLANELLAAGNRATRFAYSNQGRFGNTIILES